MVVQRCRRWASAPFATRLVFVLDVPRKLPFKFQKNRASIRWICRSQKTQNNNLDYFLVCARAQPLRVKPLPPAVRRYGDWVKYLPTVKLSSSRGCSLVRAARWWGLWGDEDQFGCAVLLYSTAKLILTRLLAYEGCTVWQNWCWLLYSSHFRVALISEWLPEDEKYTLHPQHRSILLCLQEWVKLNTHPPRIIPTLGVILC